MEYNIYCDESCHLLNDNINDMVLGAVWCPKERVKEISDRIKQIKKKVRGSSPLWRAKFNGKTRWKH